MQCWTAKIDPWQNLQNTLKLAMSPSLGQRNGVPGMTANILISRKLQQNKMLHPLVCGAYLLYCWSQSRGLGHKYFYAVYLKIRCQKGNYIHSSPYSVGTFNLYDLWHFQECHRASCSWRWPDVLWAKGNERWSKHSPVLSQLPVLFLQLSTAQEV